MEGGGVEVGKKDDVAEKSFDVVLKRNVVEEDENEVSPENVVGLAAEKHKTTPLNTPH